MTPFVAAPTLADRLAAGIAQLTVDVDAPAQARLVRFLASLARWNAVYNLTAVRDIDDMLAVHLLDSLSILPLVDTLPDGGILDVGSGAGLPGIPLAIARPHRPITTVDAVAKKIAFQQQVKAELPVANLTAVHARVEALTLAQSPVCIVSRAYTALPEMLRSIDHLATTATTVIAMKGVVPTSELAALPADWRVDEIRTLDVPDLGARRCAVVLRRPERR